MSLLSLLMHSLVHASESCPALPNGLVLNKYYLNGCAPCRKIAPIYEDIKSQLKRADVDIKFRELECRSCDCENATSFPTLEITNDTKSIGKKVGLSNAKQIKEWINKTLNITIDLEDPDSKVKTLTHDNFVHGIDGQNLILFYKNKNDGLRGIFRELANDFENKIKISEIHESEAKNILHRYNVTSFPHIVAINNGTTVPFFGLKTFEALSKYAEQLYEPAFQNITLSELKNKKLENGEPIFLVLYKNYETASEHFNELAQQFKFRAKIYRSNDPALFDVTGKIPTENGTVDEQINFVVYKNSTFFTCPFRTTNKNDLIQWIFHSHFPHVTNLDNFNFYSIFHGIKPVFLFLTEGEHLVDKFNKVSADKHLGFPFINTVFATLDAETYPEFANGVLGEVKTPSLLFYNPFKSKWYYNNIIPTEENFEKVAHETIERYFEDKLPLYPPKKSNAKNYLLFTVVVGMAILGFKTFWNNKAKEQ